MVEDGDAMNRAKSRLIGVGGKSSYRASSRLGNALGSNQPVPCLWLLFVRRLRLCGQSVGLPTKVTAVALTSELQLVTSLYDSACRTGMLQVVTPCVAGM